MTAAIAQWTAFHISVVSQDNLVITSSFDQSIGGRLLESLPLLSIPKLEVWNEKVYPCGNCIACNVIFCSNFNNTFSGETSFKYTGCRPDVPMPGQRRKNENKQTKENQSKVLYKVAWLLHYLPAQRSGKMQKNRLFYSTVFRLGKHSADARPSCSNQ